MFEGFKAQRAYIMHARGKLIEARRHYEELFASGFDDARYYASYSMLLISLEEYETACEIIRDALDYFEGSLPKTSSARHRRAAKKNRDRDRAHLRLNLALALWKLGDIDEAVRQAKQVIGTHRNATAYGTLGFLLIAQGDIRNDYAEALAFNIEALDYDQAHYKGKKVHPNILRESAVILDNAGQVYYRLGERCKAKEYFMRAHEYRKTQADTLYFLARIAADEGDATAARTWIEALYDRPSFPLLATVPKEKMDALRDEIVGVAP